MSRMLVENLEEKWGPVLDHADMPKIQSNLRKSVTAVLLENQEKWNSSANGGMMNEAVHTNFSGGRGAGTNIGSYDPILISLVRRSAPLMIAFDIAGVQPMTGPTGLIFAMKAKYQEGVDNDLTDEDEALHDSIKTWFSGAGNDGTIATEALGDSETDPSVLNDAVPGDYDTGIGMTTLEGEDDNFSEMGFTIDKISVTAKTRQLKAEFTDELSQDLRAVHGLDAETELANILQQEILLEINREVVRTIYQIARIGAQDGTDVVGIFDLDIDSNGRWSGERFKGLMFQIERESNRIARETRRGKGNILICTSDVASALSMSGDLDFSPAMTQNLNVDDTASTFAGTLRSGMKVYVDPYSTGDWFVVGYKGSTSNYDAGLFYAPYVPLQMVRAIDQDTFQPKIAFKTRYGMVTNPFANVSGASGDLVANANIYYRRVKVLNLM